MTGDPKKETKKEETLAPDPATMTNTELHAHFNHLLVERAQDVDNQIAAAMEKIDGLEETFNAKLDAKFQEVLDRLPAPAPAAQPAPQPAAAPRPHDPNTRGRARWVPLANQHAAPINTDTALDGYSDEDEDFEENERHPRGRPQYYYRNARPPQVRDDDHIAKLKLTIPPFNGKYNPDAYLIWELEVQQRFAYLNYPEDKRVSAATCEFTDFASIWWSEYCRLNHDNVPITWDTLKRAMRTRFVPPYYQRELL